MIKQLRVLAIALLCAVATAANAQYSLTILAPANVAGVVPNTVIPNDQWGFGTNPVSATGFCKWATPDTLATTSDLTQLGDLRGKIAVVKRGVEFRDVKAWRCQRAGAIGVIIVNNDVTPPSVLDAGDSGGMVTIPVILVQKSWGIQYSSLIDQDSLQVQLGNIRGLYQHNLRLDKDTLFIPDEFAIPHFMVRDTGDIKFQIGGELFNYGTQAAGTAWFKAEVFRLNGGATPNQRLYGDSVSFANFEVDSIQTARLRTFDLVGSDPATTDRRGHYQLVYSIYEPGVVDGNTTDNRIVYDMYLTDSTYSKSRLNMSAATSDPAYLRPLTSVAYTKAGGGDLRWGHYQRTGAVGGLLKTLTFAMTTNDADSLSGESANLEVYKWVDASGGGDIDESETTLLGSGFHAFESNSERDQFFTIPIADAGTGDIGVRLDPNTRYLYVVNYGGVISAFIAADENVLNYALNFQNSPHNDWYIPLFNGTTWGFFTQSIQAAIRVDIDPIPVANRPSLGSLTSMSVHPNPAQSMVQVSVGDKTSAGTAALSIRDLAGHEVYSDRQPLQGTSSYYKVSVAHLPAGLYNVMVSTGQGAKTQKLVITR